MTCQKVKTMETCDSRENVSDDPSASRRRVKRMMTTVEKPLECLPSNHGRPHINNQRMDPRGGSKPKRKVAEAQKKNPIPHFSEAEKLS